MADKEKNELPEDEGLRRLKEKSKDMKNRHIVPPVDNEEPTGLLSGGPDSLDLEENKT